MDIFSRIELIDRESDVGSESKIGQVNMNKLDGRIRIRSGIGIGRVTKPGLGIEIGRPAINQVPIEMIVKSVEEVVMECDLDIDEFLGDKSILVTIFAPRGEEIAKQTFNSNLGILGGISDRKSVV